MSKKIYYLYADLGGTYTETYAQTEDQAKEKLFDWMTTENFFGPIPKSCIEVYKINEEDRKESCRHRRNVGERVDFSVSGMNISLS